MFKSCIAMALVAMAVSGCQQSSRTSSGTTQSSAKVSESTPAPAPAAAAQAAPASALPGDPIGDAQVHKLASGLQYWDLKVGDGTMADPGLTATVHYTGWLADGTKFDSSLDRGQPFPFQLGAGSVIRGWDEGVKGMRVGGKRKLLIPPDMGYGDRGAGGVIPPNATLVFDVELLGVK